MLHDNPNDNPTRIQPLQMTPSAARRDDKILAAIAGGTPPDVVTLAGQLAARELLQDATRQLQAALGEALRGASVSPERVQQPAPPACGSIPADVPGAHTDTGSQ